MSYYAFYNGISLEVVSHPQSLAEAEAYFKSRYKVGEFPLVVICSDASEAEFQEAMAKSRVPLKSE